MKILVVEDDPSISGPSAKGCGERASKSRSRPHGAAALAAGPVDLVLLDLGLPDLGGNVVCQRLRDRSAVPIIVVTAHGEEIDRVVLLELGADDYVVKPFGFRELVARIRAVLRRTSGAEPTTAAAEITVGSLHIDRRTRAVVFEGATIALTPKEYDLLVFLAADAGAVRGRDQLIHDVWDENWWGSTKTLDVHVASLRKKLRPELIETVRSVGYRLVDLSSDEP